MSSLPSPSLESDELPPAHSLKEAADSGDQHQEIARLAYQLYLDREGGERSAEEGSAEEDWLRAEQQIRGSRTEAQT